MALFLVLWAGHSPEGPWLPSVNHLFLFPSLLKQLFWPLSPSGSFYKTHLTLWVLLASYCFSQLNSEPFSCGFYLGKVDSVETINISLLISHTGKSTIPQGKREGSRYKV